MNVLYEINPDPEGTEYKYSDELFNKFYGMLKYYSWSNKVYESVDNIDLVKTKEDHELDGCRIWDKKGCYVKIYDCKFLIEISEELLPVFTREGIDELSDLVEYLNKEIHG